jgi:hypothetical protein
MTRKDWLTVGLALAFGALLGYIDLNSQEVQLPMFCLLLFSFTLGVAQPKAAWRWGLLMGLSLPLDYFVAFALNYRAVDDPRYPITLVILVIPALIAAYGGAFASRLSQPPGAQAGA